MRILKIELQNINSLKSATPIVIDFESEKFRDVGLFAITGSTGAGKTTILDAVTIAMYHSVPRFNKSNIKAGLEEVVSYGADDAMARVTFENKGIRYEVQWSIRLTTKTGKRLNNPKEVVRLKNLNTAKIIAEKKREVQTEIENITRLTYPRFLRSVMLAQGEFAAFLSANAKEKGNLLEQITGEEIYKKIGEAVNDKIFEERKKLSDIRAKINSEDLLSGERRKELDEEQHSLTEKIKTVGNDLKQVERIINWFKKNKELVKEQETLKIGQEAIEKENEENQFAIEALALHEKAEPFKELIDEIVRFENEIKKNTDRSVVLTSELETISTKLTEAQKLKVKNKQVLTEKENELKQWLPKLEQVTKLEAGIENELKLKTKIIQTISELSTAIKRFGETTKHKKQECKQKATVLKEIENFLQKNIKVPEIEKRLNSWNSQLTQRKSNRERIRKETRNIRQSFEELDITNAQIEKTETIFSQQNKNFNRLKEEVLELSKLLQSYDLENLLEKQKQLESRKANAKDLLVLSQNYIDFGKKKEVLGTEEHNLKRDKKIIEENLTKVKVELVAAEKSLQDAESILELERTIKSFEEERKKLEKGKPCSLCGATEHPYVEKYAKIELSTSQTTVNDRKKLLEKLKKAEKNTELKLAETKTKLETNLPQAQSLQKQIEDTLNKFNKFKSELQIDNTEAIANVLVMINKELNLLSVKISETQKLQQKKNEDDALLTSQGEKVNKLKKEIAILSEKGRGISDLLLQKKEDLRKVNLETEKMETALEKELSAFDFVLPSPEDTSGFIQQLQQKISSFHSYNKQLSDVQNAISQLSSEIKNNEEQQKEKSAEKEKQEEEIRNINDKLLHLYGERNTILPKEITTGKKRTGLQQAVEIAKEEADKVTSHYDKLKTEKATGEREKENLENERKDRQNMLEIKLLALEKIIKDSIFASRQEIEKALLSFDDKTKYTAIRKQLDNKTLALKTRKLRIEEGFSQQKDEKDFEMSADEALKKYAETELVKEQLLKRAGQIKQQFILDNQIKERNQGVFEDISAQEKVVKKWTDLMALLGGSKHAFNTYVQRLTLQNLIRFANIHLFKLNRRYSLKMNETYKPGEELNFQIVDHYQTDEVRPVDTSSGGEKFLISLALALGLSDLASHNVSIESLFIDEGFGALDNNTLETVISTLETLHAQGKMIGVISHVENLKERIPTQIQVSKKRNGVSEVEII